MVNRFLLAGDKFMPQAHLRQPATLGKPGFTYSELDELDKTCFSHNAAYFDSKNLAKRTAADKVLRNKAFSIAKDPRGTSGGWLVWCTNFLIKSKFNKGFRFLLCVIDIFSKYAWVVALKVKKGTSTVNAFQKISKQSARKPSKICVDKGSEFYNAHFKK